MKNMIFAAAFVIAAPVCFQSLAHAQLTGVSRPDSVTITVTADPAPPKQKPAAGIPATTPTAPSTEVFGPYVPYHAPGTAAVAAPVSKAAFDPDANIVTSVDRNAKGEVYSGFVTSVDEREGELREGTLVKVRMMKALSTGSTTPGTDFMAELAAPVMKNGRVILPVGAVLQGRVTAVHSGKRISGAARMRLDPHSVTLPDGTQYMLHAQLIDALQNSHIRVGSEGDLKRRDHAKTTWAIVGGVTGAGAIAGAAIGGGVGAAIGAGIGAGAGAVVWLKQDRQAELPKDSLLVFSLTMPMPLTPMRVGALGGQ